VALTETQRIELYERIKRTSLGEEGANVVMNALPNVDWDSIATHDDLALLRADLRREMADLRGEMTGLRGEMGALRSDVRADLVELENRLQRSIVTWILAAQGVTLAATSLLVTVLAFTLG
jgi:hypothetical protein